MLTLVEALNYRCLRYISRPMDRFHVLVGPNASGKTTFLDVVAFLSQLVSDGFDAAMDTRSPNFDDLTYRKNGDKFELAIEAIVPQAALYEDFRGRYDVIRYEVALGKDQRTGEVALLSETLRLQVPRVPTPRQMSLFPDTIISPNTLFHPTAKRELARRILSKSESAQGNFYSENYKEPGKGWNVTFKLGPRRSALANLPEDETKFPAATWFKNFLANGVQKIVLDSLAMRNPSPPGLGKKFKPDGSNLPWVIEDLRATSQQQFQDWIEHVRTALPDFVGVRTVERPEDRHRYLVIRYEGGLEVPSWTASDGTLRLLALTLIAYTEQLNGVVLIEEPENGIHPRAVETMFDSLSNVYDSQVLLATHSPVILSIVDASQVLCFAKDDSGATDIVLGSEHPRLQDWQHDVPLGDLFAAGVLG